MNRTVTNKKGAQGTLFVIGKQAKSAFLLQLLAAGGGL